jgi:predicted nucleotidyltransferase
MDNLPASLCAQRDTLARCLEVMNQVMPLKTVCLFGSHARGDARPDSDIDLCLVAEGAGRQMETAVQFRRVLWPLRPGLSFTLVPITPYRLQEKKSVGDHFLLTVLREGVPIAQED